MKMRASFLAVIASVVLMGCTTPLAQSLEKGRPRDISYAAFFVGRPAPFTAGTDTCSAATCAITVDVDSNCNISIVNPVLNLLGTAPFPRVIVWTISNNNYKFPPADSTPPPLVVDKSGQIDPVFVMPPNILGPFMKVTVTNNHPRLSHEYGLNIIKNDGTKCPPFDPWVIE
jgi:hypothetical protein